MKQDGIPDYGVPWVPAANVPLSQYANRTPPVDFSNFRPGRLMVRSAAPPSPHKLLGDRIARVVLQPDDEV